MVCFLRAEVAKGQEPAKADFRKSYADPLIQQVARVSVITLGACMSQQLFLRHLVLLSPKGDCDTNAVLLQPAVFGLGCAVENKVPVGECDCVCTRCILVTIAYSRIHVGFPELPHAKLVAETILQASPLLNSKSLNLSNPSQLRSCFAIFYFVDPEGDHVQG